jgi:signal transduction histidine kinase
MNTEIFASVEIYVELAAESMIFAFYSCYKLATKKSKSLTIFLWIILMGLVYYVAENIPLEMTLWLWIKGVMSQIYVFTFIQLAFKGTFKQKALLFVDILATCWIVEIITTGAVYLYRGSYMDLLDDANFVLLYRLMSAILLSTTFSVRLLINNKNNRRVVIPIILIQIMLIVSELLWCFEMYKLNVYYTLSGHVIIYVTFNFIAVLLNYSTVYIYNVIRQAAMHEQELEYAQKLKEKEYMYYQMALENDNKIRCIRHEIGNQLQTIDALVNSNNKVSAKDITDSLKSIYASVVQIDISDNELENNVKLEIEVRSIPAELKIKNLDLSVMLNNLIDNAIEATSNLEDKVKTVLVKMVYNSESFIFVVQNPTDMNDGDFTKTQLKTSKKDEEAHGIGLTLVKKTVDKYQGKFTVTVENGIFTTKILIMDV